jgi:uncharacterized alkaline shock family protein YloU
VAAVVRDSAWAVPGVLVALGRTSHGKAAALAEYATVRHHHPRAAVGVLGRTVVIDLAVAVRYGDRVHLVARDIQRHVITAPCDNLGLETVIVNVSVNDVLIGDEDE